MSHQIRTVRLAARPGRRAAPPTASGHGRGRLLAMAGLGQFGAWRHGVVAATVLGGSVLALTGLIGTPHRGRDVRGQADHGDAGRRERPAHPGGRRRGLRDRRPSTATSGSSPTTSASRPTSRPRHRTPPTPCRSTARPAARRRSASATRTRRCPASTATSSRYTLPDARLTTGLLALDIIGTEETLATDRFEVVVTGLELDDPLCNVGSRGTSGGCTLDRRRRHVPDGDRPVGGRPGRHDRRHHRRAHRRRRRPRTAVARPAGRTTTCPSPRPCSRSARVSAGGVYVLGPAARAQRGLRRRRRRRRLRLRARRSPRPARRPRRPGSSPTTTWASWPRPSSSRPRASSRGRARC